MKKADEAKLFIVTAGEGCCCGPAFGPSSGKELFEIPAKDGPGSLILHMQEPIAFNNELLTYLVVTPRYAGDTLKVLRENGGIVDVARVLPDQFDRLRKGNVRESTEHLAVGECRPIVPRVTS